MADFQEFIPARRRGVILHTSLLLLFMTASGGFLLLAMAQENRGFFILYLVGCIGTFLPIPLLIYRLFTLLRAKYIVDRDGLHIQWGLRTEDIPMQDIEWMRTVVEMPYDVPLPRFSVQGSIIGLQHSEELGKLEFVASDSRNLILVACRSKVLVISPRDMDGFQHTFDRFAEMGSITPIQPHSANVELLLSGILKDRYTRSFILGGLFLSICLLLAASFIVPARVTIFLGFDPSSGISESAPSERLLLLPLFSLLMLVLDVALGAYLFRKENFRIASYFVFASSLILPLSFVLLILFHVL
jgi:hypothetical protein